MKISNRSEKIRRFLTTDAFLDDILSFDEKVLIKSSKFFHKFIGPMLISFYKDIKRLEKRKTVK